LKSLALEADQFFASDDWKNADAPTRQKYLDRTAEVFDEAFASAESSLDAAEADSFYNSTTAFLKARKNESGDAPLLDAFPSEDALKAADALRQTRNDANAPEPNAEDYGRYGLEAIQLKKSSAQERYPKERLDFIKKTGLRPEHVDRLMDDREALERLKDNAVVMKTTGDVAVPPQKAMDEAEWNSAVDATNATPAKKAKAKAHRLKVRDQLAGKIEFSLAAVDPEWEKWSASMAGEMKDASVGEKVERFIKWRKASGAKMSAIDRAVDQNAASFVKQFFGLIGGITNIGMMKEAAATAGEIEQANAQIRSVMGGAGATGFAVDLFGGLAPTIAFSPLARLATTNLGAMRLMGGIGAAQSYGGKYADASAAYREQGLSDQDAHMKAQLPALVSALTTYALARMMPRGVESIGQINSAKNAAKTAYRKWGGELLADVGDEALEEALQAVSDEITAKFTYDPSKDMKTAVSNVVYSGLMGAVGGGVVGAVSRYANKVKPILETADQMRAAGYPMAAAETEKTAEIAATEQYWRDVAKAQKQAVERAQSDAGLVSAEGAQDAKTPLYNVFGNVQRKAGEPKNEKAQSVPSVQKADEPVRLPQKEVAPAAPSPEPVTPAAASHSQTAREWESANKRKLPQNRAPIPESLNLPVGTVVRAKNYGENEGDIVITGPLRVNANGIIEYPADFTGTGRVASVEANEITEIKPAAAKPERVESETSKWVRAGRVEQDKNAAADKAKQAARAKAEGPYAQQDPAARRYIFMRDAMEGSELTKDDAAVIWEQVGIDEHKDAISAAIKNGEPVSADAVQTYGMDDAVNGWTKKGDKWKMLLHPPAAEQPTPAPAAAPTKAVEQAIADAVSELNWLGTVREVPAPRSMGGEGVKLYIPVDASGKDVTVGGQTILGKTPEEAIELAQKNTKPASTPQAPAPGVKGVEEAVFTREEIDVSKPSISRRKRPDGTDGESVTEISAPSSVTNPDNWNRLGDINKLSATVEARLDFASGKTPKKTDQAWTAYGGRRTERNRPILARGVTYEQALEAAKDHVESANTKPTPAPAPAPTGAKTRLDLMLDGVERTGKELNIEVTDANRDNLTKIIETAEKRGLRASTDGRFVLIRPAEPKAKEPWQMTLTEHAQSELDNYTKGIREGKQSGIVIDPGFPKRLPKLRKELDTIPKEQQLQIFKDRERESHKRSVEFAIADGKPVPAEVLADYPDLAKQPPAPSPAPVTEAAKLRAKLVEGATVEVTLRRGSGTVHRARLTNVDTERGVATVEFERSKSKKHGPFKGGETQDVRLDQVAPLKSVQTRMLNEVQFEGMTEDQKRQTKADAKEFDRLVRDHPEMGWYEWRVDDLAGTKSGDMDIAAERKRASMEAMEALGGDPTWIHKDNSVMKAELLPKLKAAIEEKARELAREMPDSALSDDTDLLSQGEPPATPKLRPSDGKGTGELLQGDAAPFNLVAETAADIAKREAREAAEQVAKEAKDAAEAKAKQDKEQGNLFDEDPFAIADSAPTTSLPVASVQRAVRVVAERLAGAMPHEVIADGSAFPDRMKEVFFERYGASGDLNRIRGVVVGGKIYINAAAIENPRQAIETFMHEAAGHGGTDMLLKAFGEKATAQLDAMLKRLFPDEHADVKRSYPSREQVSETLAKIMEGVGPEMSAQHRTRWQRVVDWLRNALNKLGVKQWSTNDVMALLRRGVDAVRKQRARAADVRARVSEARGDEPKMSYAGEKAQVPQFMRDSLDTAKAMAAAGKTSEEIRAVTGWFPGKYDGKMRWEVPDEGATWTDKAAAANESGGWAGLPLEDVLDHPSLFEVYPSARNIRTSRYNLGSKSIGGRWDGKRLELNSLSSDAESFSSLLHEVQHWIQENEGFAQGADPAQFLTDSPVLPETVAARVSEISKEVDALRGEERALGEFFRNLPDSQKGVGRQVDKSRRLEAISSEIRKLREEEYSLKKPHRDAAAIKDYRRTAGEIESRDVQARQNFTPEQRKAVEPYSSENIAKEDAIVMRGDGPKMSVAGRVTPEQDRAYADAVKRGDMETAQRMVDAAAKVAGAHTNTDGSVQHFIRGGNERGKTVFPGASFWTLDTEAGRKVAEGYRDSAGDFLGRKIPDAERKAKNADIFRMYRELPEPLKKGHALAAAMHAHGRGSDVSRYYNESAEQTFERTRQLVIKMAKEERWPHPEITQALKDKDWDKVLELSEPHVYLAFEANPIGMTNGEVRDQLTSREQKHRYDALTSRANYFAPFKSITRAYLMFKNPLRLNGTGAITPQLVEQARKDGYDAIWSEGAVGGETLGRDNRIPEVVVLSAEQVKSSEPSEVPLSKRFNPDTSDIRFSLKDENPATDSRANAHIIQHKSIPVEMIDRDQDYLNPDIVSRYEDAIRRGQSIEPPLLMVNPKTGRFTSVDGHHRIQAYKNLGITNIAAAERAMPPGQKYEIEQGLSIVSDEDTGNLRFRSGAESMGARQGNVSDRTGGGSESPEAEQAGSRRAKPDYRKDRQTWRARPIGVDSFATASDYIQWVQGGRLIDRAGNPIRPDTSDIRFSLKDENPEATSTKRAFTDAARAARGEEPTGVITKPSIEALKEGALAELARNPDAGRELVREIIGTAGQPDITPEKEALLAMHRRTLQNEIEMQSDRAMNESLTPEQREIANERWDDLEQEITELEDATNRTGSAWSNWGRIRMQETLRDFSFAMLTKRARKIKGGEQLTRDERAELKAQADAIIALHEKELARRTELANREREEAVTAAFQQGKAEAEREAEENQPDPLVTAHSRQFIANLRAKAAPAVRRVKGIFDKGIGSKAGGESDVKMSLAPDPEKPAWFNDVALAGSAQMAEKNLSKEKWLASLKVLTGDTEGNLDPYADELWTASRTILEAEISADTGESKRVKATKMKRNASKEQLIEGMAERVAEDGDTSNLGRYLKKLAVKLIGDGVDTREALVDAMHDAVKDIDPSLTREAVMDLWSDYGKFRPATTDEVKVKAAQLRGEVQQVRKLMDMEKGLAAKLTGIGRVEPSAEHRKLTKQVEDAKRRGGFAVTDPARQLRTAMDAIQTRLKNEIADMDYAIATRKPLAEHKNAIVYDAVTKGLKAQRDAKKAEYEKLFPKDTAAADLAAIVRALDRSIAELSEQIKAGQLYPGKQGKKLTSPEIEAKRARIEALRDERTVLRGLDTARVEAAKTAAAQARIDELNRQRAAGWPDSPAGTPTVDTPELAALKARRDALLKERQTAQRPPTDPEMRRIEALDKLIAEKQAKIAAGDTSSKPKSQNVKTAEVTAKEAELRRLTVELAKLRNSDIARQLEQLKSRKSRQLADLLEKIAKKDFEPKAKPPEKPTDPELQSLDFQVSQAKGAIMEGMADLARSRRTGLEKTKDTTADVFHTARALMTGGEFSGVFRQGKLAALSHPVITFGQAVPAMFRAFGLGGGALTATTKAAGELIQGNVSGALKTLKEHGESKEHAEMNKIWARPNAAAYKRSGLALHNPWDFTAAQLEGNYRSRWANKIPFIAGSGRAYTLFLNNLRAGIYDTLSASLSSTEGALTAEQEKEISNFINKMTGSGNLGVRGQKASEYLNIFFFAPKFVASRFQMITGAVKAAGDVATGFQFAKENKAVRKLIAKEYGKILTGIAVMYALYAAFRGDDEPIETDPRSSKFGKIPMGNGTYVDPLAGLSQVTVFLNTLLTGEVKNKKGNIKSVWADDDGSNEFGKGDGAFFTRFVRSKMSPVAGLFYDRFVTHKFVDGKPFAYKDAVLNLVNPMTYGDIYDAMRAQGVPKGTVLSILALFGEGVNTYESDSKPTHARRYSR
jgi:hypothetical protein